jgi:hypothetical protein
MDQTDKIVARTAASISAADLQLLLLSRAATPSPFRKSSKLCRVHDDDDDDHCYGPALKSSRSI